jgi:murein DD-endopeptidase MepM/ murein hydrolase activator NlpD
MQKLPLIGFKDFGYSSLMKIIQQSWHLRFLIALSIFCSQIMALPAVAEVDPTVILKLVDNSNGAIEIDVQPPRLLEATVTIKGTFENMKGTSFLPLTMDLTYGKQDFRHPFAVFKAVSKDTTKDYSWDWEYRWQVGNRGGRHNDNVAYFLPYRQGEVHAINQTYGGSFSHAPGSDDEFAIDFDMPTGNVVCAARGGTVVAVRIDSNRGGETRDFAEYANYIVIKHDDGTYGRYLHLRQNGSLVKLGQVVQARQPIGLSGGTGWAQLPHLHFEVFVPISGERKRSIPVKFITRMGIVPMLMEGMSY